MEPCWAGLNRSKTWRGSGSSRKESEAVEEPNGHGTEAAESESPRRHRRVLARTRCSESVREGGPGGESRRGELNPRSAPYQGAGLRDAGSGSRCPRFEASAYYWICQMPDHCQTGK